MLADTFDSKAWEDVKNDLVGWALAAQLIHKSGATIDDVLWARLDNAVQNYEKACPSAHYGEA